MSIALVVPAYNPEQLEDFFQCNSDKLSGVDQVYISWDGLEVPKNASRIDDYGPVGWIRWLTWQVQENMVGTNYWIFPRQSSAHRSFGFWLAWKDGHDIILTLDDDCRLFDDQWVESHVQNLNDNISIQRWEPICDEFTRGFPFGDISMDREVVLSHGLWKGVADWDAPTQLVKMRSGKTLNLPGEYHNGVMPADTFWPMCGMNLGFKRKIAPLMYFGLQGPAYPFNRFDDIWCGIILQKIAAHCQWALHSGRPLVRHDRQSDVFKALKSEENGIEKNEFFWRVVDRHILQSNDPFECLREIVKTVTCKDDGYWERLEAAYNVWISLFT